MYKIEKNGSTFILTFDGIVRKAALDHWLQESELALATCTGAFGVIVDMRTVKPLSPNAQAVIVQGQSLYKKAGMERSAVILNSPLMTMQTKRLSKESGIYAYERYFDASNDANWEKHALAWVKLGIDPDK
jgi:hypothetical protein